MRGLGWREGKDGHVIDHDESKEEGELGAVIGYCIVKELDMIVTEREREARQRTRIFFFFQAEDGIRDIGVTGVQTCALPIWSPPRGPRPCSWSGLQAQPPRAPDACAPLYVDPSQTSHGQRLWRGFFSLRGGGEGEGRVGGGCRSRWASACFKKKRKQR